jgi:V8-like Glu-specific endopeptidase
MDDDWEYLQNRAERAFGGVQKLADLPPKVRAIIGPSTFPDGEQLAQEAMDLLRKGIVPSPKQRAALEAAIKAMRPSILSESGQLQKLAKSAKYPDAAHWSGFVVKIRQYLYSIGRIDRITAGGVEPVATGFLIGPTLLVTNKHVLTYLSSETMALEPGQAVVNFGQEYANPDNEGPYPITRVKAYHSTLDIALLEIGLSGTASRPGLPVTGSSVHRGDGVVAIGYPQQDARNPVFMDLIFESKYAVKRAAPGEVLGTAAASVYHDCSTLGGNSGSPLVSMSTGQVVGLHRDGPVFLFRNEAVDAPSLAEFVQPHL